MSYSLATEMFRFFMNCPQGGRRFIHEIINSVQKSKRNRLGFNFYLKCNRFEEFEIVEYILHMIFFKK